MFKRSSILATVAFTAGCVSAPPPPPQAPLRRPPPVTLRPAPPPPVSTVERPFTPGTWSYSPAGGGVARFGAGPLFEAQCDAATRGIVLTTTGAQATAMTLRASTTARTVAATATATGTSAQIAATDPILDAMAFSRGSFTVQAGATVLTLPARAEFTRVIEDCRG